MMNFWLAQAPAAPPLQPLPHPELPEVFLPPAPLPVWIFIVGALFLVALLALVLWLLLRPKPPMAVEPKRPWQQAMNALKELATRARGLPPGAVSAEVSEILRGYFLERYKIPAPFRTTHEIFQGGGIPATSQRLHRYAPLAELWDQLSFAPVPASADESMELVAKAMTHLEEDRP
ncbi:uncharacterized protein DUF4381 [Prosthecobacter fusiformis]|uniref:Uncharacterized protein DUF4381 n=1 Tax=Prosthecobacter fusiformis TaxID=48464 RepID=A0A4R7RQA5_9BACT|nr:DUF4381 family protein [Prosthecobacter fusiformis]TDU67269.1 uncharacterized protein DUF4381 [Prosthecobacter fusiformis]